VFSFFQGTRTSFVDLTWLLFFTADVHADSLQLKAYDCIQILHIMKQRRIESWFHFCLHHYANLVWFWSKAWAVCFYPSLKDFCYNASIKKSPTHKPQRTCLFRLQSWYMRRNESAVSRVWRTKPCLD
jgi:hypothetical protein